MVHDSNIHIAEQFQLGFREQYREQIQNLIQESRKEAFEQAKKILKDETLSIVLKSLSLDDRSNTAAVKSPLLRAHRPEPSRTSSTEEQLTKNHTSNPALSERILKEIEAIREQILRNEELLSQLKPFIRPHTTTEEKR